MKENHRGLDALAALCGGVARSSSTSNNTTVGTNIKTTSPSAMHRGTVLNTQHPVASAPYASLDNAQQQWYQAFVAAAACGGVNPLIGAAPGVNNANKSGNADAGNAAANAVQQLAFYHAYQAAAAAQAAQAQAAQAQIAQQSRQVPLSSVIDPNIVPAIAMAQQMQSTQQIQQQTTPSSSLSNPTDNANVQQRKNVAPQNDTNVVSRPVSSSNDSMPPPPPPRVIAPSSSSISDKSEVQTFVSPSIVSNPQQVTVSPVSMQSPSVISGHSQETDGMTNDGKKLLKRAANRRSAQLSRKRKKQFIEELKEENDDLRRKEQILSSIPDLVIVFDSAGKLWFVSRSVHRFLDFSPHELEGTSFWDRLCDESVRLLKAAFMDALAAKKPGVDTEALGSGLWEVRLVDRDQKLKLVTLNGVVHFSGESPECVCSIRPSEDVSVKYLRRPPRKAMMSSSDESLHFQPFRNAIKPQQSVISTNSSDDASVIMVKGKAVASNVRLSGSGIPPISDGESVISGETTSDES